jgi:hypothetical protein
MQLNDVADLVRNILKEYVKYRGVEANVKLVTAASGVTLPDARNKPKPASAKPARKKKKPVKYGRNCSAGLRRESISTKARTLLFGKMNLLAKRRVSTGWVSTNSDRKLQRAERRNA